jgi:hypothetical protein
MQRSQGQSLITAGRDVFRRLFAFQRSSVLEVCRFSASKWTPKPLNDCRSKRGLNDSFAEFDSTEDEKRILRVPNEYVLRVLNSTGALIREECEIECSRGIFTASPGKIYLHLLFILYISVTFISISFIHCFIYSCFSGASFSILFSVFILFNFYFLFIICLPILFYSIPSICLTYQILHFSYITGSVCVAYERSQTTSGVVRFRTAHGWLSEYRRDQQRDPIMELLSLTPCRAGPKDDGARSDGVLESYPVSRCHDPTASYSSSPHPTLLHPYLLHCIIPSLIYSTPSLSLFSSLYAALYEVLKKDPAKRKLMEAMTIRESSSYAMTRVHNSLKKVAVFLVYLCHVDPAVHRLNQSR